MKRPSPVVLVLGLLTAVQAGTGLWRIIVMYQEGLRKGFRPFELSTGLFQEIGLALFIGLVAWWWLPRGNRRWSAWAIRFLVFAWLLALAQMLWVYLVGYFEHGVSWAMLLVLFLAGIPIRRQLDPAVEFTPLSATRHPALWAAAAFWLLQLPHLFFPYHWTDTKNIWACRTVGFDTTGDLTAIFDCLDPARPPLHSVLLWLGHTNGTIEGRLLPFLMVGAFGILVYHFLRRVAPDVAGWGLLWFFMTVRVYQGSVSNYADIPVMMAIGAGVFLAVDGGLTAGRWQALLFAGVAGAAAALIKRDGGALVLVATGVLWWFLPRKNLRTYAALAGAVLGFLVWNFRPEIIQAPATFQFNIGAVEEPSLPIRLVSQSQEADPVADDTTRITVQNYVTMFYGMQGQVLSHYGYGVFLPTWIILGVWVWRRREHLTSEGQLFTWLAVLGWLAIVGIYVVHVATGHPSRGSLRVIRTAFGRHLVHMFVFAVLSGSALAQLLLAGRKEKASP